MIASQARQAKRSRTVWITLNWRGITSSVSVTSSPSLDSLPWQQGQAAGPGITTRSRGRWAGNGARSRLVPRGGRPGWALGCCGICPGGGVVLGGGSLRLLQLQLELVQQLAAALG